MRVSPNGKSASLKKPTKTRRTGVAGSRAENPPSTNVSSPLRASKNRAVPRAKAATLKQGYTDNGFVVDDDESDQAFETRHENQRLHQRSVRRIQIEEDDSEDDFGPIREAGRPQRSRRRDIGPPITMDEKVASLNPAHRDVLEGFLLEAKKESENVCATALLGSFFSNVVLDQDVQQHSCRAFLYYCTSRMAINFPRGNYIAGP